MGGQRVVLALVLCGLVAIVGGCGDATSGAAGTDVWLELPTEDLPPRVVPGPDGGTLPDGDGAETADGSPDAGPSADVPVDDGSTGFDYPCEPGTWEACVTACASAGQRLCLKDWGPCQPPVEFCGNCADDDCDGLVDEDCPDVGGCEPPLKPECPTAVITVAPGVDVDTGTTVALSATSSVGAVAWKWSVQAPAGSASALQPSDDAAQPTLLLDVAGTWLLTLTVFDGAGEASCLDAQQVLTAVPSPPLAPQVGCADGQREGFLDEGAYAQIAACGGAWSEPGISPPSVVPTCGRQGEDDGPNADGGGCAAPDLCAEGWHVCDGWQDVAAKSPTGCAGAVPQGAASKSLFFAMRQASTTGSVCGAPGDGYNDVFGCGNLGAGLGPDKGCGPLDRVLASTVANACGFNEAEPPLGPWQCLGGPTSHLEEGERVTKSGCPGSSCSYDGQPVSSALKGGVLCCRD